MASFNTIAIGQQEHEQVIAALLNTESKRRCQALRIGYGGA
jgi:hypothetical protein